MANKGYFYSNTQVNVRPEKCNTGQGHPAEVEMQLIANKDNLKKKPKHLCFISEAVPFKMWTLGSWYVTTSAVQWGSDNPKPQRLPVSEILLFTIYTFFLGISLLHAGHNANLD